MPSPALRTVTATKYLTPFREGGSLPGLVEADDDGLYVVKFRGAAQGPRALVAEVIAGELGHALGLPVPELVLVDVDPALAGVEPDPWVGELLGRSPGLNVGIDFLPGSMTFDPRADGLPDPALAADIVWFDALVTNTDRSPRIPTGDRTIFSVGLGYKVMDNMTVDLAYSYLKEEDVKVNNTAAPSSYRAKYENSANGFGLGMTYTF